MSDPGSMQERTGTRTERFQPCDRQEPRCYFCSNGMALPSLGAGGQSRVLSEESKGMLATVIEVRIRDKLD